METFLRSVTAIDSGNLVLYSRPIGMKSNGTVASPEGYRSYWLNCISTSLKAENTMLLDDIGYYRVLGEETLLPQEDLLILTSGLPNWKQKQVATVAKCCRKIWIDLLNEAVELSYIYTEELVMASFQGYAMPQAAKVFETKPKPDLSFSETCSQMVTLLSASAEDASEANYLMSPAGNTRSLQLARQQKRFSMNMGSMRNQSRMPRQSVTIVHHKDKAVMINIPIASDSESSDSD